MSVIWSNLRMASLANLRTDGRLMECTPTFVRLSAECFVNFIWWSAFVLDGVLSDRSNTTCQTGGLFVRIDSMSFPDSASHLGPIFFILDINGAFDIFENVSVLGYADGLKLCMTIKCIGDCQLFQRELERLSEWCRSNKFDLNAGK
jgi:hypothetical protein